MANRDRNKDASNRKESKLKTKDRLQGTMCDWTFTCLLHTPLDASETFIGFALTMQSSIYQLYWVWLQYILIKTTTNKQITLRQCNVTVRIRVLCPTWIDRKANGQAKFCGLLSLLWFGFVWRVRLLPCYLWEWFAKRTISRIINCRI